MTGQQVAVQVIEPLGPQHDEVAVVVIHPPGLLAEGEPRPRQRQLAVEVIHELVDGLAHDVALADVHVEGRAEAVDGIAQDDDGRVGHHRQSDAVVTRGHDVGQDRECRPARLGDVDEMEHYAAKSAP